MASVAVRTVMDDDGVEVVYGILFVATKHTLGLPTEEGAQLFLVVAVFTEVETVEWEFHGKRILQWHLGRMDGPKHLNAE